MSALRCSWYGSRRVASCWSFPSGPVVHQSPMKLQESRLIQAKQTKKIETAADRCPRRVPQGRGSPENAADPTRRVGTLPNSASRIGCACPPSRDLAVPCVAFVLSVPCPHCSPPVSAHQRPWPRSPRPRFGLSRFLHFPFIRLKREKMRAKTVWPGSADQFAPNLHRDAYGITAR
jgi:hypothetical protein